MDLEPDLITSRPVRDALSPAAGDLLAQTVRELSDQVCAHPVFGRLTSLRAIRMFMEHHVWAVWDFMSLLKSIQAEIAPVSLPWKPPADVESARLINEIVVSEEGDYGPDGRPTSHFLAYLRAMKEAGAATVAIDHFVSALALGVQVATALAESDAPPAAKAFVTTTLKITREPLHCRVSAFTLGREEVIPKMFRNVVAGLDGRGGGSANLNGLVWYLDRHISIDGDQHAPMAERLYSRTCLRDERTRNESLDAARRVLERRLALWDAVAQAIADA